MTGAATARQRRAVYRVKRTAGGWRLEGPSGFWVFDRKRAAVSAGRRRARMVWEDTGRLAQLVVHGADGRIQYEATYGRDPARRRG